MRHKFLKELAHDAHKYSHGKVCVVAGSRQYAGAAVLCVGGARRGGAGYISYMAQDRLPALLVLQAYPDVVVCKKALRVDVDAWVIGSGAPKLPRNFQIPAASYLVLDSTAMKLAPTLSATWKVLTPHLGEAERLGFPMNADLDSRISGAREMADSLGVIVVLKGPETIIATPHGKTIVNDLGGAELATAGTGDILAGLIGSMLASWQPTTEDDVVEVLNKAVSMHALASQAAAKKYAPVTATDLLEQLAYLSY